MDKFKNVPQEKIDKAIKDLDESNLPWSEIEAIRRKEIETEVKGYKDRFENYKGHDKGSWIEREKEKLKAVLFGEPIQSEINRNRKHFIFNHVDEYVRDDKYRYLRRSLFGGSFDFQYLDWIVEAHAKYEYLKWLESLEKSNLEIEISHNDLSYLIYKADIKTVDINLARDITSRFLGSKGKTMSAKALQREHTKMDKLEKFDTLKMDERLSKYLTNGDKHALDKLIELHPVINPKK